jgi:uncharacterized protein (DUF2126 family)
VTTELANTQSNPEIEERLLATCDPSMLPETDLPALPLDSWWWRADWEGVEIELRRGKVVVISVESGEAEAVKMAALFCAGGDDLVFRHDPGKGRLYLMRATKRPARAAAGQPEKPESSCPPLVNDLAADCLTMLYDAPIEVLAAIVPVLAKQAGQGAVPFPGADDRDGWLNMARDVLPRVNVIHLISNRETLRRLASQGWESDAA